MTEASQIEITDARLVAIAKLAFARVASLPDIAGTYGPHVEAFAGSLQRDLDRLKALDEEKKAEPAEAEE